MRRSKTLLSIVLFASALGSSAAQLQQRDFTTPGDGDLTFDPASGLEWLDLDRNYGTAPSTALATAGHGFRYATLIELDALVTNQGLPGVTYGENHVHNDTDTVQRDAAANLFTLLGPLEPYEQAGFCVTGYIQNAQGSIDIFDACALTSSAFWSLYDFGLSPDQGYPNDDNDPSPHKHIGTLLVRDAIGVPEPASWSLWLSASLALIASRVLRLRDHTGVLAHVSGLKAALATRIGAFHGPESYGPADSSAPPFQVCAAVGVLAAQPWRGASVPGLKADACPERTSISSLLRSE